MKKLTYTLVAGIVSVIAFTQFSSAQEKSANRHEGSLEAQMEKSNFMLLEPMPVEFKLTLPITENATPIVNAVHIRITFEGKSQDFRGLTLNMSLGEPQPLPARNSLGAIKRLEPKSIDRTEEVIIDRVSEFFPDPGSYRVQFFLKLPAGKVIRSNIINLTVEEPTGINKDAFDFLNKYENGPSFYWVWKEANGISLLEKFVNSYGQSVYGESAILYLAGVYKAKGDLDKAQAEFEKIKLSRTQVIADVANKSLADIAKRKADLQRSQESSEKPNEGMRHWFE